MKRIFLNAIMLLTLTLVPALSLNGTASAACGNPSSAKGQVLKGIGETGSNCEQKPVINVIHGVINILSLIVGIVAIIMVIVGGFKYITSSGDSNKVANAKSTLIYALVGLIIAAVAQILVHFVLFQTDKAVKGSMRPNYNNHLVLA